MIINMFEWRDKNKRDKGAVLDLRKPSAGFMRIDLPLLPRSEYTLRSKAPSIPLDPNRVVVAITGQPTKPVQTHLPNGFNKKDFQTTEQYIDGLIDFAIHYYRNILDYQGDGEVEKERVEKFFLDIVMLYCKVNVPSTQVIKQIQKKISELNDGNKT